MSEIKDRNFIKVTETILESVEYIKETPLEEENRYRYISEYLSYQLNLHSKHHIPEDIITYLKEMEYDSKMTKKEYLDFEEDVNKINRNAIYIPPEGCYILWEKLCDVCMYHFKRFPTNIEWIRKISRIIRNLE